MSPKSERVVVSVAGQAFVVTDPEEAFGDAPEEYRQLLITTTADDIVALMFLDTFYPIIVPPACGTQTLIDERKRGLKALGVEDIDAEIDAAMERFRNLTRQEQAKMVLPFMS